MSGNKSQIPPNQANLLEILHWRALHTPDLIAMRFFANGLNESESISYLKLFHFALAAATQLNQHSLQGKPVLLLYSAGIEFLATFLGCMMAGCLAVAIPAPDNMTLARAISRIGLVARNVGAKFLFTNLNDLSSSILSELHSVRIVIDRIKFDHSFHTQGPFPKKHISPNPESSAFLQFTSGSTGVPQGIIITHRNLTHQLKLLSKAGGYESNSVMINWMPHFHDYGLINGLLLPVYLGIPYIGMPPAAFLRHPIRWLNLISLFRGTHSCAPNFGYDYCCRNITKRQLTDLNLRFWCHAGIGAEPINPKTLHNFSELVATTGFLPTSFCPAYGLAESTLAVSYSRPGESPSVISVELSALQKDRVVVAQNNWQCVSLVGCGQLIDVQAQVRIVNPTTLKLCAQNAIGEIWVSSQSVAKGYWKSPNQTKALFNAHIKDTGEGPFLRTGDLGFLYENELFITGRRKDVIIIGGQNHYPQDIERAAETSCPSARSLRCVAFSVLSDSVERVVLVLEARRTDPSYSGLRASIRQSVLFQCGIELFAIVLVRPGSLPKTSSGKLQRQECRAAYLSGRLKVLEEGTIQEEDSEGIKLPQPPPATKGVNQTQSVVMLLIKDKLKALFGIDVDHIEDTPFATLGLGSLQLIRLANILESELDCTVSPVTLFGYPTVALLAARLIRGDDEKKSFAQKGTKGVSAGEVTAVVGMGCRFPGAGGIDAYESLLSNGVESISVVPRDRWSLELLYSDKNPKPNQMNTCFGGFLSKIDLFDRKLFGVGMREADAMDPQQRLLLEVTWEAFEDAAESPVKLAGSNTGVFIGVSSSDYGNLLLQKDDYVSPYAGPGGATSVAANRISYVYDFHGPSMAVDTACSSSLVAVHLACRSLLSEECDMAVVGGVNLLLSPGPTIALSQAGLMSPDGHCKTFDASANGYVRSEGCGVVILKRLSDALAEGNRVITTIDGTAINQDGKSNGITAPNPTAQREVIVQALKNAKAEPSKITYVEAHGTGTALGDAIELNSIRSVVGEQECGETSCFIGSVKANIGHLEAAAGIASLIKVCLMLDHGVIPPQINFTNLNPQIMLDQSRLVIPKKLMPWPPGQSRMAGVSAFGIGGTNAHIIASRHEPSNRQNPPVTDRQLHILTIAANDAGALLELLERYVRYLGDEKPSHFADLCFTSNIGRAPLTHRIAVVARTAQEAAQGLSGHLLGMKPASVWAGVVQQKPRPVFYFNHIPPGTLPASIDHEVELNGRIDQLVSTVRSNNDESLICCLATQVSLGLLWREWGIEAQEYCGQEIGKFSASCVAGKISFADCVESALCWSHKQVQTENPFPKCKSKNALSIRADSVWSDIAQNIACLFVNGADIAWSRFHQGFSRKRVRLPLYPFQRERHWF